MNYSQPITVVDSTAATDVTLEGDWEGFYMDWDQANGTLYVKSDEVTRLVGEYVWLVTVTEGGTTVTAEFVYSVVPATPVITPITDTQTIYRGIDYSMPIGIMNNPDKASVEGLQVGMKHEANTDEDNPGLKVIGRLPTSAVLTETNFIATAMAENPGGMVTSNINFSIGNVTFYLLRRSSTESCHVINFNAIGEDISSAGSFDLGITPEEGLHVTASLIYFRRQNTLYSIPRNTPYGQTATRTTVNSMSASYWCIDGTEYYRNSRNINYVRIGTLGSSAETRRIYFPSEINSSLQACRVDGNDFILMDAVGTIRTVFWIDKDTPDQQTATIIRQFDLPPDVDFYRFIVLGNALIITYRVGSTPTGFVMFDKQTGESLFEYTVPISFHEVIGFYAYTS